MTKAIHKNLLKDEASSISSHLRDDYGTITDHLRNHVHLTNCIHLKNHMHHHSPNIAERSLIRDLIVLQKSRSLRDPSTSPPSWVSPSIVAVSGRRGVRDGLVHSGRRSVGVERKREVGRLSTSSPAVGSFADSKWPPAQGSCNFNEEPSRDDRESKTEEAHQKSQEFLSEKQNSYEDLVLESKNVKGKDKKKTYASSHGQASRLKTLSEQLEEVASQANSHHKKSSQSYQSIRNAVKQGIPEGPPEIARSQYSGQNKGKRRRLKGKSRANGSAISEGVLPRNGRPDALSSIPQGSVHRKDHIANAREEYTELDGTQAASNVCGIPWNWSRIHHRSRSFLDKAGRSLSCGLSDSRLRKAESTIPENEQNVQNMLMASGQLTSSTSSDSEVLPLLTEPSYSQASGASNYHLEDYSGELGIFSNNSTRYEGDSDLASEARFGHHRTSRTYRHRHRSLTQKYMPKTFKDLVGQNLVAQALSNAVSRQKVGLVYVFYGPHGTGKTSCARVFAKALNCHSMDHPRPCDVCSSCISHNLGRSRDVVEVGPVGNYDFESIMDVFENVLLSPRASRYKVFIIDDCDTLPPNLWSVITKVIDRAPRHVVFVLVSLNLDHLPHIIISRCQKFFFPKLKDSDIISTLQWISSSEGMDIEKDALKLIASRSDGSLRDAEMTLDQLTLLGQKITLSLVQELVGLVSDEKLVDLLDLALSADAVNTVKTLREIMESGVEPLALMSQLATIITDILAGSYVLTQERIRRKFFRRSTLSKEDMEKLRQALKTLSEAEKQLRVSNDKLTWLTAALLQIAPDQQYMRPGSSADRSANNSPLLLNDHVRGGMQNPIGDQYEMHAVDTGLPTRDGPGSYNRRGGSVVPSNHLGSRGQVDNLGLSNEYGKTHKDNGKMWKAVLENIRSDSLRQFLYREGKLNSVKLGAAPTVQLSFSSNESKSRAEKFRGQILEAFESLLASSVTLEIRCESRNNFRSDVEADPAVPSSSLTASKKPHCFGNENLARRLPKERWSGPHVITEGEIIEAGASGEEYQHVEKFDEERQATEPYQNKSIIKGKVSLAHVIQHVEVPQRGGWSRRKATSIAEKLEQENLRLEPRARSLLCWKASRRTRTKFAKLRIRTRRPRSLLKLITCGRCLSGKSPRRNG